MGKNLYVLRLIKCYEFDKKLKLLKKNVVLIFFDYFLLLINKYFKSHFILFLKSILVRRG